MSKVTVIGAGGSLGKHLAQQALDAGPQVTALVRAPARLPLALGARMGVRPCELATIPRQQLTSMLAGQDAVINVAGTVTDGQAFVDLVDSVACALEALGPSDRRPVCWFTAGVGVLDLDASRRRGSALHRVNAGILMVAVGYDPWASLGGQTGSPDATRRSPARAEGRSDEHPEDIRLSGRSRGEEDQLQTRLSDHAYAYTAEGDPNTGIVIGDDAVLVADTQATPAMAQDVIRRIREVTDKPIRYVVLTHYHAVRVLGASAYQPEQVLASQDTYDLIVLRASVESGVAAGQGLNAVYKETVARLKPKYGDRVIFDHCMPFDVTRCYDEATHHPEPRIWTAERDRQMWETLEG